MRRYLAGLLLLVAARLPAQHCAAEHYRWPAKIDEAHLGERPTHTTVGEMLRWPAPEFTAADAFWCQTRNAREQQVYELTAWARRLKVESDADGDGDWHIELTGTKAGDVVNCIVVEIPPAKLNASYSRARQALLERISDAGATVGPNGDVSPPVHVRVTGLAFFDGEHRGVGTNPPNNHGRCNSTVNALWEIHPVYWIGSPAHASPH